MPNPIEPPSPAATAPPRTGWLVTGIVLAAVLSAITGVISYFHGLDIARVTGNAGLGSYLLPLVPDVAIAMSSLVLFIASSDDEDKPPAAVAVLAGGISWTVAQNVAAGWHQGWGGRVIDAGVPLAFVGTFELLLWLFRRFRKTAPAQDVSAQSGTPEPLDTLAALQALLDSESERNLAFILKVDRMKVKAWRSQMETAGAEAVEDEPEIAPKPTRYAFVNGSGS